MKEKYKKFYMMFDKRFKNLILCSNLNCDGGIIMDDNFAKWLELATDLAEKTIKTYTRAIKKISFDLFSTVRKD